jgi:hypothetical protein
MPVKRRMSKRRRSPEAEAEAWSTYWRTGYDFFGEASAMSGLTEPSLVWPPEAQDAARQAWEAASEAAWKRCGHLFERKRHAG